MDTSADSVGARLAQPRGFHRFRLGDFEIIPLLDGVLSFDRPPGFVRHATDEQVAQLTRRRACQGTR